MNTARCMRAVVRENKIGRNIQSTALNSTCTVRLSSKKSSGKEANGAALSTDVSRGVIEKPVAGRFFHGNALHGAAAQDGELNGAAERPARRHFSGPGVPERFAHLGYVPGVREIFRVGHQGRAVLAVAVRLLLFRVQEFAAPESTLGFGRESPENSSASGFFSFIVFAAAARAGGFGRFFHRDHFRGAYEIYVVRLIRRRLQRVAHDEKQARQQQEMSGGGIKQVRAHHTVTRTAESYLSTGFTAILAEVMAP